MGLDFTKTATAESTIVAAATPVEKNEIATVEEYDIQADRAQMETQLANSEEVDRIVSSIDLTNMDSIVNFGAEVAEEISKASDVVLNSMTLSQLDDTGTMLKTLSKVMNQFDIDEIKEDKGFWNKLFGNAKKQLDKILAKYHTMGEDIDKIYVQLKGYETEIKGANKKLNTMFDANVSYYHELVKYILAGEQACKELENYIAKRTEDMANSGDQSIQFELTSLNQALLMMEQRTQDLRTAENVAMQSIPMIKTMEFSNYNLVRKINSAFIITLPVFKQALAQAILLKRQKLQAESLAELDKRTNEMLVKNAQNTMEVSQQTAKLASGSSIQIETLETTWRTITNGIEETRRIEEEARKKRIDDKARLEEIKEDFKKKYTASQSK
ncbi:MAG: toxic anion resistance protein [Lachnospiraceae bacterium]|nr:toxic anion resistance protein [Lachnospiraceae bacterium]